MLLCSVVVQEVLIELNELFHPVHRNGLLTEHNFVEVNGQNVVGLKVSKVKQMLDLG